MTNRFNHIRNILWIVLLLNWVVAAAKVIYGLMTQSAAMTADGFHSFADGISNIIGLIGIWIASRPVDTDHPYGHEKYETFATIVIAGLLFFISFNIIKESITRLIHPVLPEVTPLSFFVMAITLAINIFVFIYEMHRGKVYQSDILVADAQHTKSDILVSVSVVFTLFAVKSGFPMIDTIVSLAIAGLIAHAAYQILRESSDILCDRVMVDTAKIREIVCSVEGVRNCHKVRTRGHTNAIHADLHVIVDPAMAVEKAHKLSHTIQETLKGRLPGVIDIAVHIEPDSKNETNLEN